MAVICCVTVAVVRKYRKRQNVNTQQVELQTIRSPRTTQITSRTSPSRPFPNRTFNTIPQTRNQYPSYVTRYLEPPPPPYNPHYSQESSDYLVQQPPFSNLSQPSAPPHPYEIATINTLQPNQSREVNTLIEPPPPSYSELFEN